MMITRPFFKRVIPSIACIQLAPAFSKPQNRHISISAARTKQYFATNNERVGLNATLRRGRSPISCPPDAGLFAKKFSISGNGIPTETGYSTSLYSLMTRPIIHGQSVAVVSGHAAFCCMGIAFLTRDMLYLRLASISSITLSMVFQYYRPQPLHIPLRWNSFFLLTNLVLASALYSERCEADDMSKEMIFIYESGLFENRGFSKVDFYRLFRLGKKETRKKGDFLKRVGHSNNELCYIIHGSASIDRDGSFLSSVSEHDFVSKQWQCFLAFFFLTS
mmetsp:Transcript_21588/g.49074  ORF Transcript_21588/g.49074 Transcript_21588/m.49074 type:complete len:277 (-) Transcript_21588:960-1790(-)